MVSPVPKHLRSENDHKLIAPKFRVHVADLVVDPSNGIKVPGSGKHRAKFAPGLATELVKLAGSTSIGDPMAGTGMLCWETGKPCALNDINAGLAQFLGPLTRFGAEVTYVPAHTVPWSREVCIFSPPYYPRTDRKRPNAHDDEKRGPIVGFRDAYDCDHPDFIGNPGGVDAILMYREQMTRVYSHLKEVCGTMIVVVKNWMRLGVELRLDLDTILMAHDAGWEIVGRHGWQPPPSLWARFNADRGGKQGRNGMVLVEDVLVFRRRASTAKMAMTA